MNTTYFLFKIAHVISAGFLIGYHLYWAYVFYTEKNISNRIAIIKSFLRGTILFVIPLFCFQLFSGFDLISQQHYAKNKTWIFGLLLALLGLLLAWMSLLFQLLQWREKAEHSLWLKPTRKKIILSGSFVLSFVLVLIGLMSIAPFIAS